MRTSDSTKRTRSNKTEIRPLKTTPLNQIFPILNSRNSLNTSLNSTSMNYKPTVSKNYINAGLRSFKTNVDTSSNSFHNQLNTSIERSLSQESELELKPYTNESFISDKNKSSFLRSNVQNTSEIILIPKTSQVSPYKSESKKSIDFKRNFSRKSSKASVTSSMKMKRSITIEDCEPANKKLTPNDFLPQTEPSPPPKKVEIFRKERVRRKIMPITKPVFIERILNETFPDNHLKTPIYVLDQTNDNNESKLETFGRKSSKDDPEILRDHTTKGSNVRKSSKELSQSYNSLKKSVTFIKNEQENLYKPTQESIHTEPNLPQNEELNIENLSKASLSKASLSSKTSIKPSQEGSPLTGPRRNSKKYLASKSSLQTTPKSIKTVYDLPKPVNNNYLFQERIPSPRPAKDVEHLAPSEYQKPNYRTDALFKFDDSVFMKFRLEEEDELRVALDSDFMYSKIFKFVKDPEKGQRLKFMLSQSNYYQRLVNVYRFYQALDTFPTLSYEVLVNMFKDTKVFDENFKFHTLALVVSEVNNLSTSFSEKGLMRHQFLEVIIKLGVLKYARFQQISQIEHSLLLFLDFDFLPYVKTAEPYYNGIRYEMVYSHEVDKVLKKNKPYVDKLYSKVAKTENLAEMKDVLHLIKSCKNIQITKNELIWCFSMSLQLCQDEYTEGYTVMKKIEFYEFVVRIAIKHFEGRLMSIDKMILELLRMLLELI